MTPIKWYIYMWTLREEEEEEEEEEFIVNDDGQGYVCVSHTPTVCMCFTQVGFRVEGGKTRWWYPGKRPTKVPEERGHLRRVLYLRTCSDGNCTQTRLDANAHDTAWSDTHIKELPTLATQRNTIHIC